MIGSRGDPDPNIPLDQDPPPTSNDESNDSNGAANVDEDEDDEDDGAVAGPTVEAHVDLAKTPCE